MSRHGSRSAAHRRNAKGVAVGLLAATLVLLPSWLSRRERGSEGVTVSQTTGRSVADPHDARATDPTRAEAGPRRLAYNWLIRPDIAQEPPLAVPVALAVDEARGRVFLLELKPSEVRVYSAFDGGFLARLGQEGRGPAEFRAPMSMAVNGNGELAVVAIDGKTTFWSSDGVYRGSGRVGGGLATRIVIAMADSFMVKVDRLPPADVSEFHVVAFGASSSGIRFNDADVSGLETGAAATRNHAYAVAGNEQGELLLAPPGPTYRILRISPRGKAVQEILRPEVPPLVRTEGEIAALRSKIRRSFDAVGRGGPKALKIPPYRSHIAALAVASDGEIWAVTKRGNEEVSIIDRFDARGRFLSSYEVELRIIDLAVSDRSLYLLGVNRQELPGVATARRPAAQRVASAGTGGDL